MKIGIALPQCLGRGSGDLLARVDALPVLPSHVPVWCSWDNGSAGPPGAAFPTREVAGLTDRGIRPVIFWQPAGPASQHASILRGDHDGYIDGWAHAAADWGGTVLARFAWEQNWGMPWGPGRNGNTAASYISMWRYVVGRVRSIAPRVLFWWCPNVTPVAAIDDTWPGDPWVDRVGLDGYAWRAPLRPASTLYGPALDVLRRLSDRPVLIGEFGVAAGITGRRAWLRDTVRWFDSHGITAAIYFSIDMRWAKQPDWRLPPTMWASLQPPG